MKTLTTMVVLTCGLLLAAVSADAVAATGFLKGERNEGLSKICFYDVLGETHTINVSSVRLCPQTQNFDIMPKVPAQSDYGSGGKTGFLKGDHEQGLSKMCYYDVLGESYALTISAVKLCPLSHRF